MFALYKSVLFFQHDSIDSINVDPDPTNPIRSVSFETGVRDLCVKIGNLAGHGWFCCTVEEHGICFVCFV